VLDLHAHGEKMNCVVCPLDKEEQMAHSDSDPQSPNRWKVVGAIVSFVAVIIIGHLVEFLLGPILSTPLRVLLLLLPVLAVLALLNLPKGTILEWAGKLMNTCRGLIASISSKPNADSFRKLFDFEGEEVKIIYTCRSRIDEAPCPEQCAGHTPQLRHVIKQHIPVDEFITHQLLVQWYRDQIGIERHEELKERFTCSYPLDEIERESIEGEAWLRSSLPDFMLNDNLIIIGENSCSNLILGRLRYILNFGDLHYREIRAKDEYPKIELTFIPNHGNAPEQDRGLGLRTAFEPHPPNAVAMICYAPNPFNVQRSVLILYGCHRVGQYLLEDWLLSPESTRTFRRLLRRQTIPAPAFGQIVLHGAFEHEGGESYELKDVNVIVNTRGQIPFFPFDVRLERTTVQNFIIDNKAKRKGSMADISLVIELGHTDHVPQSGSDIDRFFQDKLPFLEDHYWESQATGIGLHVTLYEFATHMANDKAFNERFEERREQFGTLRDALEERQAELYQTHLSLVGYEVFPSSIVLYSDLPTDFVERVRKICGDISSGHSYYNMRRLPFPLHCTVVRFTEDIVERDRNKLLSLAASCRKHVFGKFQVKTLSLVLTEQQPFQSVGDSYEVELDPQVRSIPGDYY
jgi:hypothetical protein